MKRMIVALAVLCIGGCTPEVESDESNHPIVGIWKLESWRTLTDAGNWDEEFGSNPKGYFVYGENGFLSIHLMHEDGKNVRNCRPEDFDQDLAQNTFLVNPPCYVGYFGRYRVESESTVVHLPEGGTILSYIDTEQPRAYKLHGDSLWIEWSPETERLLIRQE